MTTEPPTLAVSAATESIGSLLNERMTERALKRLGSVAQMHTQLRKPFPDNLVSKLPKATCSREEYKQLRPSRCSTCNGWHPAEKTIHLDYVGHAAITDRLLEVDPEWTWEPMALTEEGLPRFDAQGGLWIRLTVGGVTRLGYGNAAQKAFGDPGNREKEIIGDALRNAAMRFGCGLDLWHKGGPMHDPDDPGTEAGPFPAGRPVPRPAAARKAAAPTPTTPQPIVAPAPAQAAPATPPPNLMAVLEAFQDAETEEDLLALAPLAAQLPAKDKTTAKKAYGVRRSELQLRSALLQKIRPAFGQALIDFCGEDLGLELRSAAQLAEMETVDLETIGKWLGTAPLAGEPEEAR